MTIGRVVNEVPKPHPSVDALLHTAAGVLIALYGYDVDDALAELQRVACAHNLNEVTLARALLAVAGTRDRRSAEVVGTDVIAAHWGEELSFCRTPARHGYDRMPAPVIPLRTAKTPANAVLKTSIAASALR